VVRVIACDDGMIRKLGSGRVLVACIRWSTDYGLEDLEALPVSVDGLDATSIINYLIFILKFNYNIDAVFLDSITIGGFNIVSPETLFKTHNIPILIIYNYKPSYQRLSEGVKKSGLAYSEIRLNILKIVEKSVKINTRRGPLYVIAWKTPLDKAKALIEGTQYLDRKPVPLRMAHYIASALSRVLL